MSHISRAKATCSFLLILLASFVNFCYGSRKLNSLYQPPPTLLTYHKGGLLQGEVPISILWYGKFTPAQKSIISDFVLSLVSSPTTSTTTTPSVSKWWSNVDNLVQKAGKNKTHITLANQVTDEHCSIGKLLERAQLLELARRTGSAKAGVALVLTADDVAVEGFCMSSCGSHGAVVGGGDDAAAFVWVGNSMAQCPGQCAWPFHQPVYGPQNPPLVAPNGDVGADGMVINVAGLLAGAVTNPFGGGYFVGEASAAVEVAAACAGVYGKGAYPGYAGELLVDSATGASYNVEGVNGRKFLVPAMFDPLTSACSPVV